MPKTRPPYPPEFRVEAVRLLGGIDEIRLSSGFLVCPQGTAILLIILWVRPTAGLLV